jgi:glucosylceramidase
MSAARACLTLTVLAVAACRGKGGSPPEPRTGTPGSVAEAWVTTSDKTKLLTKAPNAIISAGDQAGITTHIDVDTAVAYQEMVGFGAAITDASAWLIQTKLSAAQRDSLMQDLFGRDPGIGLSFTRLTIGASDFSRTHYSFDDMPAGQTDTMLARFSIDPNRSDVLPVVKRALAINPGLEVMASPWSAPGWMKTTRSLIKGTLRAEAYPAFAEYLRRYIQAYQAEGVPIFAITVQNEPHFEPDNYPGMRLTPAQRADLLKNHLGPLFRRSGIRTQILDWDHNWDEPSSPLAVLGDSGARTFVSGIAWHCYAGNVSAQTPVHDAYPEKDAYFTECSGGQWAPKWADNLQWLTRTLLIGSTRGWAKGVLFWNLALDESHGPHLGGCGDCRGVVTINSASGAVARNEEYYALAHASRFVRPGARRIASSTAVDSLETVAFRNADDGSKVLIVVNTAAMDRTFAVRASGRSFRFTLPAGAVVTLRWR